MSQAPKAAWRPPQEFEEYSLIRRLGSGGMGQVWLAHDTLLDRPVAIKFMIGHLDVIARERFLIEARAAARIQHPNVVSVYRIGELRGQPFIVSELIRGISLDRLDKPVSTERALELARGLARGLAAAHRRGVLHRDLKPGNAILDDGGTVKLLDFGLAKVAGQTPIDAGVEPTDDRDRAWSSERGVATEDVTVAGRNPRAEVDPASAATLPPPADTTGVTPPRAAPQQLTQAGAVMGTPRYMSPEAWRGAPATQQSDVYGLGVVLYELCAGRTPFHELAGDALRAEVPRRDPPPLAAASPDVTPELAAIVDRCIARDPLERFPSAVELWDALEELATRPSRGDVPSGNPYRGLLAFHESHRALYFGRDPDVRAIVERLRTEAFVLVAGESGVGKSSLCRAGVLPVMAGDDPGETRRWRSRPILPGPHPLHALAAALAPDLDMTEEEVIAMARRDEAAPGRRLRQRLDDDEGLILYVDQLEELVTLGDGDEAGVVSRVLAEIAGYASSLRVLASVRTDFLARVAALPGLGAEVPRAFYLLRPLDAEALRQTILGPARATGVTFESPETVDALVEAHAGTAGSLPLLQFTLAQLWERRDRDRDQIPADALEKVGGVEGALARYADDVLVGLAERREVARRILVDLVTLEGTRARRTADELTAGDASDNAVLESLVRARLVVARESEGDTTYEVAHEALISGWGTLQRWLDREAGLRAIRRRVADAAVEWERLERAREGLFSSRQLAETAELDPASLPARDAAFLRASRRAIARRRWGLRVAVAAVLALAGAVYAGTRYQAAAALDSRVDRHLDEARERLTGAETLDSRARDLRARSYAAFDDRDLDRGEALWRETLAVESEVDREYTRAAQPVEAAVALAPGRNDVRDLFADILYERALVAERQRRPERVDELLGRLEVYDDGGERLARWHAPARLAVASDPPGAELELRAYDSDHEMRSIGEAVTPHETELESGSYLLIFRSPGHVDVRYPLLLERGDEVALTVPLPPASAIPDGLVFVPAGELRFGTGASEDQRGFYDAAPIHARRTDAFLIARDETTIREWLEYVDSLPVSERTSKLPHATAAAFGRTIDVSPDPNGRYQLTMESPAGVYRVDWGTPLVYSKREHHIRHDWRRLPVTGISWSDMQDYVAWLDQSGRVPGARLCREDEWERAARGADDRVYPHGDVLSPDQANFDETYGREPASFGPDEVGSHPASRSPFGLDDMAGNVLEIVESVMTEGEAVVRGGAYYYGRATAAIPNRQRMEPDVRDPRLGFRICADAPALD